MVKVALVGVFSGPLEAVGAYQQNSLQVKIDALNASGGLLGSRVELVAADDELSPVKAGEVVRQQLLDDGVKLLVGPSSPATFAAVKGAIGQGGVPNCVTAVTDNAMNGAPLSFRAQVPERVGVGALLDYLRRARADIKKIGLVDEGDETGQSYDGQLNGQTGPAGLVYVGHTVVGAAEADPRPALQQLLAQGAQAVVLSGQPQTAARVALAVNQLGLTGRLQVLGLGSLSGYSFATAAGDAAVGSIFASSIQAYASDVPSGRWPAGYRTFVNRVTSQYSLQANSDEMKGVPAAADCVVQWALAVQRAGTFRGADVARAWEGLDIPAADTTLGVEEKPSATDHNTVSQQGVYVYTWTRQGTRLRLKQLAGPQT
jgi:branched-chain amino acid transport system substrate-binding protein